MRETLEQTYIFNETMPSYYVSTINRRSSADEQLWYAETIVWEWDALTKTRGKMVDQYGDVQDNLDSHDFAVLKYREEV